MLSLPGRGFSPWSGDQDPASRMVRPKKKERKLLVPLPQHCSYCGYNHLVLWAWRRRREQEKGVRLPSPPIPERNYLVSPHGFLSFYIVSQSLPHSLFRPLHGWVQWCRLQPHLIRPRTLAVDTTVVPRYLQGIGSRTPTDTKIHRCSSALYKMVQCSRPSLSTGSTSACTEGRLDYPSHPTEEGTEIQRGYVTCLPLHRC